MTEKEFIKTPHNLIFKTGEAWITPDRRISYICLKGHAHDWACYYIPWDLKKGTNYILKHGIKMHSVDLIKRVTGLHDLIRFYRL